MIKLKQFKEIYLYRPPVDFRKSIQGLSVIVQEEMDVNPFDPLLFIFTNKSRNRLKILYWDHTGFALWFKILEREKFSWPRKRPEKNILLTSTELKFLLEGYDPWNMRPHQTLKYEKII